MSKSVRLWLCSFLPVMVEALSGGGSCHLMAKPVSGSVYQAGDVVIGGLFPVHVGAPQSKLDFSEKEENATCSILYQRGYRWLQSMIFAVEEINRNPALLPNLNLGYLAADTCLAEGTTLGAALAMVTGQEAAVSGTECGSAPEVPVIIGDARSSASIVVAQTLGVFEIPMVSYFASCACLSDRRRYPTFFRTVPSDAFQAQGMARLLRLLGWSWVGLVSGDDDYGRIGVQMLLEELRGSGVCVAYHEVIPKTYSQRRMEIIVKTIQKSSARVVITFAISQDAKALLEEAVRQNITDRQWIATEAWVTYTALSTPQNLPFLVGTIGFALRRADIPGLGPFLTRLNPYQVSSDYDPFVSELWEELFGCTPLINTSVTSSSQKQCLGTEVVASSSVNSHQLLLSYQNIVVGESLYADVSQLRTTYNVYKAVYAVANAIQDMLACRPGEGPFNNSQCPDVRRLQPNQILHYLRSVNYTTPVGEPVHFDQNGNPPASYDILNWHVKADGKAEFVHVGHFVSSVGSEGQFLLNMEKVVWGGGKTNEVPLSVCSAPCLPGTWKAAQKGRPECCFDCLPCFEGEVSNQTGSVGCVRCPERWWPNTDHTECVLKQIDFLSYNDTMGVILSVISVAGATLTGATLTTFFRFRHTPVVRANNSELSFLLLLSLKLCFLCALVFIGQPVAWSCMLRHTLFGISFVLCISCLLSRTVVVLGAFRSTLPGENIMRYLGPTQQRLGISICTLVQVLICILWLGLSPPRPVERNIIHKILLECAMGSVIGFSLVLGYIGLLASLCLLLAFLARKLPDNFNEAKLIAFSMLIFCAVWVAFIPAYISSPGKYTVAVEVFAILASSYGLLICIFAPKCYIILLRPEKNTKKHLMGKSASDKL